MNLGQPVAKGNTADIYLSDGKIVKLYHAGFPDTESHNEAEKQRAVYSCGLPVPMVLEVTKIDGRQAVVMERIEGETLGQLLLSDTSRAEYYLSLSVDTQLVVHSKSVPSLMKMKDKLARQLLRADIPDESRRQRLNDKLESMPFGDSLCHGDFHVFNLILSGGRVYIIDWVDASSGNPLADACRSYVLYLTYSKELAELYLRLYRERRGVSREDILDWLPVITGARLSEGMPADTKNALHEIISRF